MKPRYFFKYIVGSTGFESPGLVRALQNAYPQKADIFVQIFRTGNPEPIREAKLLVCSPREIKTVKRDLKNSKARE